MLPNPCGPLVYSSLTIPHSPPMTENHSTSRKNYRNEWSEVSRYFCPRYTGVAKPKCGLAATASMLQRRTATVIGPRIRSCRGRARSLQGAAIEWRILCVRAPSYTHCGNFVQPVSSKQKLLLCEKNCRRLRGRVTLGIVRKLFLKVINFVDFDELFWADSLWEDYFSHRSADILSTGITGHVYVASHM